LQAGDRPAATYLSCFAKKSKPKKASALVFTLNSPSGCVTSALKSKKLQANQDQPGHILSLNIETAAADMLIAFIAADFNLFSDTQSIALCIKTDIHRRLFSTGANIF